jgi:ADP-heptose:LPS heptosyltransferase
LKNGLIYQEELSRGIRLNILIVKLSAIGDVIQTLPSLSALRHLYPDAHITWVVEEAAADLVKNHPYLDAVLISRRKSWSKDIQKGKILKPLFNMLSLIKELRQRRYDLVIDFHGLFKSSIIVLLSLGKRKLGYDSLQELSGLFLNEKIPEDMNKHAVDRYLDFPRYLGAKIDNVEFILPQNNDAEAKVQLLMSKYKLDDKKFIAINPYKKARMVITTDSGPMHLAAAVGTPVIALFGPTDPARTGPYGKGHTIIRADLPCSPCFLKKCATRKCMEDITTEQVFTAIEEKLRKE